MQAEATGLIEDGGRVAGVRAKTPDGELEIRADLVVGCDGRHSTVREQARARGRGARRADRRAVVPADAAGRATPTRPCGRIDAGSIFVMLNRGDYWQCAYVIPKGGDRGGAARGPRGVPRSASAALAPLSARPRRRDRRAGTTSSCSPSRSTACERWHRPGLLCIGDAAHAMSPVGGVGINLAVQDAVAAANILAEPLRGGAVGDDDLASGAASAASSRRASRSACRCSCRTT